MRIALQFRGSVAIQPFRLRCNRASSNWHRKNRSLPHHNPYPTNRIPTKRETLSVGVPRALILAPTRELALQIESDAKDLGKYLNTHVVAVVGGMDFDKQRQKIDERPLDILVATPGRLIDFCQRRVINLREVEILVIDEADRMLDMGFIPDVRRIVYQTPKKRARQTLFFSATFNDDVMNLANNGLSIQRM
ncbi:MAG: hypothetical protein CM1200mP24_01080 [Gammaproteobacteria bacterium]|nr:MAG: hypothetical protein CM1200mP24_01080 [Gammaproteobacteria bacterium]